MKAVRVKWAGLRLSVATTSTVFGFGRYSTSRRTHRTVSVIPTSFYTICELNQIGIAENKNFATPNEDDLTNTGDMPIGIIVALILEEARGGEFMARDIESSDTGSVLVRQTDIDQLAGHSSIFLLKGENAILTGIIAPRIIAFLTGDRTGWIVDPCAP
jgi:hypothetical protein